MPCPSEASPCEGRTGHGRVPLQSGAPSTAFRVWPSHLLWSAPNALNRRPVGMRSRPIRRLRCPRRHADNPILRRSSQLRRDAGDQDVSFNFTAPPITTSRLGTPGPMRALRRSSNTRSRTVSLSSSFVITRRSALSDAIRARHRSDRLPDFGPVTRPLVAAEKIGDGPRHLCRPFRART